MHLNGFNLNLLVALDALLTASTMTEAADKLLLSQPTLSGALKQLREHYDDVLVVYTTSGPQLTPLAKQLLPVVRDLLVTVRGTLRLTPVFDPAEFVGQLEIAASDWIELTVLKDLLILIAHEAPQMRVAAQTVTPQPAHELFRKGADLVFVAEPLVSPNHSIERLFEEEFVCIACKENKKTQVKLNRETFLGSSHITLFSNSFSQRSAAFDAMEAQRSVAIYASNHTAFAPIVAGTDMLAVTTRRFAEEAAQHFPVRVHDLPFDIPPIVMYLQWQPWRDRDPMLLWVREKLRACLAGNRKLN